MEGAAAVAGAHAVAGEVELSRAKRVVLLYVGASTAFLFVAGLLGMLLRESQADIVRIKPGLFYSIMTAHGLGAFVAWGAFAIMGVGFWVLEECGFRLRNVGHFFAMTAWWTMVIGVVLIVITTLFMGFGGSWVFLYPLPFHGSGEWGDTAAGLFSFGVLLTGVSIITWCMAIWHTVIGPGLGAAPGTGFLKRTGMALGFGYMWPERFKTDRKLPYPVIPLTVIGIDMIIATLPLAVLLVLMIIQSIDPSVTVDPLLAKNLLWFFGHPVVYLLLFPSVAVFYHLIPRFAKKELVAGKIVALAWLIAVIVNVIVWAHHVYIDYPKGIQPAINTAMQPLTFTITLPSAISLYSLSATIWRSDFQWTPAAKFLAAAMLSWFIAGLQGIINATIVFDAVVHNTMWIVGHFHNMALLNIGLVIFASVYAFLPKLTDREWYSESLANSHLVLTVIGGYGMCLPMLVQGLEGAPRRYAVLPEKFDTLTQLTVPFVIMTALGQVIFAFNLIQSLRGARPRRNESVGRSAGLTLAMIGSAAVLALTALVLNDKNAGETPAKPSLGGTANSPITAAAKGKALFTQRCGSCHTLSDAGTQGKVGPDLDELKPSKAVVLAALQKGGTGSGVMPPGLASGADAKALADYITATAGK